MGICDTTTSKDKEPLKFTGVELAHRVAHNFRDAVSFLLARRSTRLPNPAAAREMILEAAARCNRELLQDNTPVFRTWEAYDGQPDPSKINSALDRFCVEFLEKWN